MSERSLSPSDYHEFKHAKSIMVIKTSFKKRRSIRCKVNQKFQLELELNRCNLSCECTNCGKPVGFQLKIHGELPLKETRYQKKKRVLKRFKAIGNAILFILIYKLEAIKKWKKKMHILRAARNLTIIRRPAVLQSVHLLPNLQPMKQPIKYFFLFERTKQLSISSISIQTLP
ncbi:unnamed protein product [Paramecium octaurelia]|uniref:Uncharacterized protein n=1 Tax=Paramecium octaurelia TaxID=43137 RepID=A0A8S1X999_PAROT|nr:unnamed protein product [Paramecium octaurelia]